MFVRAKLKCVAIEPAAVGEGGIFTFQPAPKAEGDKFHTFTLEGQFQLSTVNLAAMDNCEVGKEYYVDVSPAEPEPITLSSDLPASSPTPSSVPGMSEPEVVALMASSTSEAEWKRNSDHVLRMCGGYPGFWQEAIVASGLLKRVKSSFENPPPKTLDTEEEIRNDFKSESEHGKTKKS